MVQVQVLQPEDMVVLLLALAREDTEVHLKAVMVVNNNNSNLVMVLPHNKLADTDKRPAQAMVLLHNNNNNPADTAVHLLVVTAPQLVNRLAQVTVNNQVEAHTVAQVVLSQAVTEVPLPSNPATAVLRNPVTVPKLLPQHLAVMDQEAELLLVVTEANNQAVTELHQAKMTHLLSQS